MASEPRPHLRLCRPPVAVADRILRWRDLEGVVGISRTTVATQEREGHFPRRVKLTDYCVGWRASEVQEWISGRRDWR